MAIKLTAGQKDALTELINIGFGRAGATLSTMLEQRIILSVPEIDITSIDDLDKLVACYNHSEITTIHQVFSGTVSGNALLILDELSASTLLDLLTNRTGRPRRLNASDREALIEIGNILLNAYVGSFGNILNVNICFAVPNIQIDTVRGMFETLRIGQDGIKYVLVVRTEFRLSAGSVKGHVLIVMGVKSLDALISALEDTGLL